MNMLEQHCPSEIVSTAQNHTHQQSFWVESHTHLCLRKFGENTLGKKKNCLKEKQMLIYVVLIHLTRYGCYVKEKKTHSLIFLCIFSLLLMIDYSTWQLALPFSQNLFIITQNTQGFD